MKRWAFLTIFLYLVCVTALVVPTLLLLSGGFAEIEPFPFALWILIPLVLVQAVLLFVPVRVASVRPVGRRSVVSSAIVVALPMAVLVVLFARGSSRGDPRGFTRKVTRWLVRGSILELNVAIPAHIHSRQRNECCSPAITLLGIATGLSVALLSFGPGVFFLLADRVREKTRGRRTGACQNTSGPGE